MTLHGISMGDQPFEYIVPTESEAGKVWRETRPRTMSVLI
jgi:hypothetical protein